MTESYRATYRQELSPVRFLERAGTAYGDRIAVVDGDVSYNWKEFRDRAHWFASALLAWGLKKGDRVALLAFNSEPLLISHFAVPLAGGVLVTINTRLSAEEISYILEQSGARIVVYCPELRPGLEVAPAGLERIEGRAGIDAFIGRGPREDVDFQLEDEDEIITINYTSGTTGRPKGVMYHHRGAYLNALAMALDHRLTSDSSFLWTLPMFHCNGWTFPWAVAAVGARNVCIPAIEPVETWSLFDEGVTHFCAAPTVLSMLANHEQAHRLDRSVRLFTAGAPPSPTLIAQMAALNFELEHVYGLTETYGPFTRNVPPPDVADMPLEEQARLKARQGFPNVCAGDVEVVDEFLSPVPADGATLGEVVMRGNVVMKGYYLDEKATADAFAGGWFHSGDLAVRHPDGSIELRDRKKDIIISGGENISTVEVEQAIVSHPSVLECAVVPVPHEKWGEVPKAFVTLKEGETATGQEIIDHCRSRIARFKAPKSVEFCDLPKTSTGKIQKYVLREREWAGLERRIN